MQRSESIVDLIKALNKAQAAMETAKKGSYNPFKSAKYADLTSVWAAIRKPLTENGLCVIQIPVNDDVPVDVRGVDSDGVVHSQAVVMRINGERIGLETILLHTSGEWVSERFFVPKPEKTDPQTIGSLLTYLRRYALSAIVGVCPEDDDAEGAMPKKGEQVARQTQAKKPEAKPDGTTTSVGKPDSPSGETDKGTETEPVVPSGLTYEQFIAIATDSEQLAYKDEVAVLKALKVKDKEGVRKLGSYKALTMLAQLSGRSFLMPKQGDE